MRNHPASKKSQPRLLVATVTPVVTDEIRNLVKVAIKLEESFWDDLGRNDGIRRSPMFTFASELKSMPEFASLDANAALRLVNRALEGKTLTDKLTCHEDPEMSLLAVWPKVFPVSPFRRACRTAKGEFDRWSAMVAGTEKDRKNKRYLHFLLLCHHLQRVCPHAPIIISQSAFGLELGCSARTVGTYAQLAVNQGLLTLEEEASYRRATRYWFHSDKVKAAVDALP